MDKNNTIRSIIKESNLHLIKLSGKNNFDIGKKHGELLEKSIKNNIAFYLKIFQKEEKVLEDLSNYFGGKIEEFSREYYKEIEGIALGAGVPIWQIYMLNARSEIFSNLKNKNITECTLLFFPEKAILCENWDWALDVGKEAYIFKIEIKDKPKIITLSEAGILAKIGLNEFGFGLGLNFLETAKELSGVPIHVLARATLDSKGFTSATELLRTHGNKIAGNLCLVDQNGEYINFEFDGDKIYEITEKDSNFFCHTNHFLGKKDTNAVKTLDEAKTSTSTRFLQIKNLLKNIKKINENITLNILFNNDHEKFPILVPPTPSVLLGTIGTNASITLLLKKKKMYVAFAFEDFKNYHEYHLH